MTCIFGVRGTSVHVLFLCRASISSSMAAFQPGCAKAIFTLCGSRGISEDVMVYNAYLGFGLTTPILDRVIIE
ncbi:hypothetical protein ACP275_04G129300 [Erythranthe tilingii]